MAKQHIYKDNWIIEFTPTCFHAFVLNMDEDVEDKTFLSLEKAKEWIDKKQQIKMKKKLTTEMARYIWSIIANDPSLPMSWGMDLESLVCTDNALEFHVQGFIHTGNVRIVYIEGADLFQVSLYDEEGKETKRINDVYLDNLAEVIDLNVENNRVDDYNAKVMDFLLYS